MAGAPKSFQGARRNLHNGVPSKLEMESKIGMKNLEKKQFKEAKPERAVMPPFDANTAQKEQVAERPNLRLSD